MHRIHRQEEDHSLFNQTTEIGITLTGEQVELLQESLDQKAMMQGGTIELSNTAVDIANPTIGASSKHYLDENLPDTEIDPITPPHGTEQLDQNQNHFEQRFLEIKRHVLGFHSLLEKGYETLITVSGFPEFPEVRLRSISIYPSGAIYVEGENRNGEWVSIFTHLDTISYALTKQRVAPRKKNVQEIEFNTL